jgi:hypothetical protein
MNTGGSRHEAVGTKRKIRNSELLLTAFCRLPPDYSGFFFFLSLSDSGVDGGSLFPTSRI